MKKILIITQYVSMPSERSNGRFRYLADLFTKENFAVEIVTTNYSHRDKKHRVWDEKNSDCKYKFTMLEEPGYKKNVSIKRFYSHYVFSRNLKKYLFKLYDKPDIIYCAVPSLDVAETAAKYAKKNHIRFVIDIQDLWPEAFKMVFNIPIISNILFWPMKKQADYIYKRADNIIAVSRTYLDRARSVNKKANKNEVIFLGTEMEQFDKYRTEKKENKDTVKIVYIGTLGHSYNIKIIIDAISKLEEKGISNIEFLVMGDGPLKNSFEEYAKQKNVNCIFTGLVQYDKMVSKLCDCDIAVNPIRKGSAGSIINKVGDYAMAGLPVINTQECKEYRELIEKYEIGYNCDNNVEEVAKKIEKLYKNRNLREKLGKNNRKLAEEKFDRKVTYRKIKDIIEGEKYDNITY